MTRRQSIRRLRFSHLRSNVETFFLAPASPLPLAILRIALAIVLLMQAYLLRDSVIALLSRSGLMQGPLADATRIPGMPHVGWLAEWLAPYGVSEIACLYGVVATYLVTVGKLPFSSLEKLKSHST